MNTWEVIKSLCSGKLLASTSLWIFIVPAVVKLTQSIDGGIYFNGVTLVAPQSLIYLYFSAIAFFISNILYIIACPSLIKKVGHYSEFLSMGCTVFDLSNSTNRVNEKDAKSLIAKIKGEVESSTPKEIDSSKHNNLTLTVGNDKKPQAFTFNDDALPVVFNFIYNFNLSRLWFMQLLCWAFLFIGLALITFLLISNLLVVSSEINFTQLKDFLFN